MTWYEIFQLRGVEKYSEDNRKPLNTDYERKKNSLKGFLIEGKGWVDKFKMT